MSLRITFDTNTLELACRPERFPKDPRQPALAKVHDALLAGEIDGYYSVTMLTIEGIKKSDRAEVYAGTQVTPQPQTTEVVKNADLLPAVRDCVGTADIERITMAYKVEQPARKPLPPVFADLVIRARSMGLRALKAQPRLGAFTLNDPEGTFYAQVGDDAALTKWLERASEVSYAIEDKGVGIAQLKALGTKLADGDVSKNWFSALEDAKDVYERSAVSRAFAEWADADTLASHIAYGWTSPGVTDMSKPHAAALFSKASGLTPPRWV
jgi:hypothetical protein